MLPRAKGGGAPQEKTRERTEALQQTGLKFSVERLPRRSLVSRRSVAKEDAERGLDVFLYNKSALPDSSSRAL